MVAETPGRPCLYLQGCDCCLLTPLNPIVSCSSMLISFAPLRSTYPSMQEDLLTAGLDLNQAGKWNLPIVLEDEGREMKESVVSCSNTTIDGFHLIDLPLQGDGLSDSELDKLAKELEEEIESKGEKEELWKSLLCSHRMALQNRVDQKFSVFFAARPTLRPSQVRCGCEEENDRDIVI